MLQLNRTHVSSVSIYSWGWMTTHAHKAKKENNKFCDYDFNEFNLISNEYNSQNYNEFLKDQEEEKEESRAKLSSCKKVGAGKKIINKLKIGKQKQNKVLTQITPNKNTNKERDYKTVNSWADTPVIQNCFMINRIPKEEKETVLKNEQK